MSETVLVLRKEETRGLLGMDEAIQLVEEAYRDYGHNRAKVIPRHRIHVPLDGFDTPTWFWLNVIPGAVPHHGVACVRLGARHYSYPRSAGKKRVLSAGNTGLVLLWDMQTCRMLGIVQDGVVSPLRVGATSGVAAKYLAREDAETLGVIGAGEQAHGQVQAIVTVRPSIRRVKVYSIRKESRERFARRIAEEFDVEVEPTDDAEACARGSDIVVTATTSADPVLSGAWLDEGAHVVGMMGTNDFDRRRDLDDLVAQRAGVIVVNSRDQVVQDLQPEILDAVRKGYVRWEMVNELAELCIGAFPGRIGDSQITFHSNNVGMGIQFAPICRRLIEIARQRGIGTELPADLFSTFESTT